MWGTVAEDFEYTNTIPASSFGGVDCGKGQLFPKDSYVYVMGAKCNWATVYSAFLSDILILWYPDYVPLSLAMPCALILW